MLVWVELEAWMLMISSCICQTGTMCFVNVLVLIEPGKWLLNVLLCLVQARGLMYLLKFTFKGSECLIPVSNIVLQYSTHFVHREILIVPHLEHRSSPMFWAYLEQLPTMYLPLYYIANSSWSFTIPYIDPFAMSPYNWSNDSPSKRIQITFNVHAVTGTFLSRHNIGKPCIILQLA